MHKYLFILKLAIQDNFSDSLKSFVWIIVEASQAFVFALIWLIVANGKDQIGDTTRSDLIIYYFFIFINWFIIGGFNHYIMAQSITQGTLANQLTKPIIPFSIDVLKEQGWKIFGIITGLPMLFAMYLIFYQSINFNISIETILITIPAIILGAIVFALIDFMVAFSTFWLHRVEGLRELSAVLFGILGGYVIPFTLLPQSITNIAIWLPFRYTFAFAAQIFQNDLDLSEKLFGFSVQLAWILLLSIVVYFTYKIAIRRYESYGG